MKRFRGGLVFKAQGLVYYSTLGWRAMKKKKKILRCIGVETDLARLRHATTFTISYFISLVGAVSGTGGYPPVWIRDQGFQLRTLLTWWSVWGFDKNAKSVCFEKDAKRSQELEPFLVLTKQSKWSEVEPVHPGPFVGVSQSQFFRDVVNIWR